MTERGPAGTATRVSASSGVGPYRELFERSADANLVIEGERFVDCNQATVEMLRYRTKEELLRTHPSELSPEFLPDGRRSFEKANEMMAIAFERGSHRFEWDHVRADGEVFPVEVLLTVVRGGERPVLHTVWRDITDRKRLEDELRQAQKMEAIGKLAGGVAHDFNNLLVAVLGNAQLLRAKLPDDDELVEHVTEIRRAGERAAALVAQLLAFGRRQVLRPEVIDLNAVVTDLERMLVRVIGEDVELVLDLHEVPLLVEADGGQLQQVVVNLCTNGRDAMPDGGTLSVRTGVVRLAGDTSELAEGLAPGRYGVIAVSDTGHGMEPAVASRAFEPFFTTKEVGKGTGLGLATAYGIVRQSGGHVRIESRPGRGSTVTVLLPLTDKPLSRLPDLTVAGVATPVRPARVMVVEDEPSVARLVTRVLAEVGHAVHHEADGEAAARRVLDEGLAFDLLVTDVVMPRMNGPELARRLQSRQPDLAVLFVSGYAGDVLTKRGLLAPGVELLGKPFTPGELRRRVSDLLARRADPDALPDGAPDSD